jgi:hypothetical protein
MLSDNATLSAEVIRVIHTTAKRGSGTPNNPERVVHQYWTLEGMLLAEYDTTTDDLVTLGG